MQRSQGQDPAAKLGPRARRARPGVVELSSQRFKRDDLKQLSVDPRSRASSGTGSSTASSSTTGAATCSRPRAATPRMRPSSRSAAPIWEATRAAAADRRRRAGADDRMRRVLAQIALAEQAMSGPIDEQVKLRRRANTVAGRASMPARRASTPRSPTTTSGSRMIDSPPIWQVWSDTQRVGGARCRPPRPGSRLETRFLDEYNAAQRGPILRGSTIAAAAAAAAAALAQLAQPQDRHGRPRDAGVGARAAPADLVVAGAGAGRRRCCFEPDAPLVLHQMALLLALMPVLRLLPPARVRGARPLALRRHRRCTCCSASSFLLRGRAAPTTALYLLRPALLTLRRCSAGCCWRRARRGAGGRGRRRSRASWCASLGWVAIAALLVAVGRERRRQRVAGRDADRRRARQRLRRPGAVCRRQRARRRCCSLLLARRGAVALPRRHAARRAAAAEPHPAAAVRRAGGLGRRGAERVPHLPADLRLRARACSPTRSRFGQISITLGSVLLFVFSVWRRVLGRARRCALVLQDEVLPKMALPRGVGNSISSLSYYALVMLGLLVALAAAGFETEPARDRVRRARRRHRPRPAERRQQLRLGPDPDVRAADPAGRRGRGLAAPRARCARSACVPRRSRTFEGADVVVPNGTLLSARS